VPLWVYELLCTRPELRFVGSVTEQPRFYRSRTVYIETEIDAHGCTAYSVKYEWKMYKQNSCTVLDESNLQVGLKISLSAFAVSVS